MKSLSSIIACLLFAFVAYAQPGGADLPSESVDVIKNFDAQLLESQIVEQKPTLPALDTSRAGQSYDIPTRTAKVTYPAPKLKPLGMRTEPLPKGYNGYAKLGYGLPHSFFGDAHYTFAQSKNFSMYGTANHHSANFKDFENQRFSNTGGRIHSDVYLESGVTVGGSLGYKQRNLFYYGYDTLPGRLNEAQLRQRFNLFDYNLHSFNTKRNDSDIDYNADIDGYFFGDNYAARERGFDLKIGGRKWIKDKHVIRLGIRTDFTGKEDTSGKVTTLNNFTFTPGFDFHHNSFYIKAGTNIISHNDSFAILPDIEAFVKVIGSQLGVFGGWQGNYEKNTYRSMSNYSPFISSYVQPFNTRYIKYFGGVRGTLSAISYQVQGSYGTYRDMAFFNTNLIDQRRRFEVFSDSANMTQISMSLSGKPTKGLNVSLAAQKNIINPKILTDHFGLPSLHINLGARYMTLKDDKLTIRTDFIYEDGVPFITGTDKVVTGSLVDLNLGAQYWITKNIGAFVDGNNLLNNKRQRWINYPQYGINVLFGITARF